MRTANICPTCATFENALCVLYNGAYLTNAKIDPLDSLQVALAKINANLVPLSGIVAPSFNATYIGQQYLNTVTKQLYYAKSVGAGASDWTLSVNGAAGQVGFYSTAYNLIGDNGLFWDNTAKRLGVGTTTPAYALDVAGNGRFTSSVIGTYFQNTGQNAFFLTNAGNNDFTLTGSGIFRILNNSQTTSLFSVTNAGLATASSLYVTGAFNDSTNSAGTAGQVLSSTVTGTDWISLPATPTLQQVLNAGSTATHNISISGVASFDVGEDATAFSIYNNPNGCYAFRYNGDEQYVALQETSGNVLIGLSNVITAAKFQVKGDGYFTNQGAANVSIVATTSGSASLTLTSNTTGSKKAIINAPLTLGTLVFQTQSVDRMLIDANGSLLINQAITVSSSYQLQVTGNILASQSIVSQYSITSPRGYFTDLGILEMGGKEGLFGVGFGDEAIAVWDVYGSGDYLYGNGALAVNNNGGVRMNLLPTASTGIQGDLYIDGGVVKIVL